MVCAGLAQAPLPKMHRQPCHAQPTRYLSLTKPCCDPRPSYALSKHVSFTTRNFKLILTACKEGAILKAGDPS
ncbi:MAG: hypothetical protein OGMRLDGQ_002526 [Candidatus Fervidibacter sp.]